jgi:hypothetical protein
LRSPGVEAAATAGLNLLEQGGEVAHLHVVAGALDGAAAGVAQHHDHPRAGHLGGVLEAAKDVFGLTVLPATRATKRSPMPWSNTSSGAARESMQPTTLANGNWPQRGGLDLGLQVAAQRLVGGEARVAGLQDVDGLVRRDARLDRLGEGCAGGVGLGCDRAAVVVRRRRRRCWRPVVARPRVRKRVVRCFVFMVSPLEDRVSSKD